MSLLPLDRQKRIQLTIVFYTFFAWIFTLHLINFFIEKLEWGFLGGYLSTLTSAFSISIAGIVIYVFANKYLGVSLTQRQVIRISFLCAIPLFAYQVIVRAFNLPALNSFQVVSAILVNFLFLFLYDFILLGIASSLLFHIFRVSKKIILSFIVAFFLSLFASGYVMTRPCKEMGCIVNFVLPPFIFIFVFMVTGVFILLMHRRSLKNKALIPSPPSEILASEIPIPTIDTYVSMKLWVMATVCFVVLVAVFATSRPPSSPSEIKGVSINRVTPTLGNYYDPMMDEVNIYWNDFKANAIHVLNRNTQKISTLDVDANYLLTSDYIVIHLFRYPAPEYSFRIYDKKTLTSQIVRLGKSVIRDVGGNTIVYYKEADERAHRDYFTYDLLSKIETPFYLENPFDVFLSKKNVIYTEFDYPAYITRFYSTVPGKDGRVLLFTLQANEKPCNVDVSDEFIVWTSCNGKELNMYNILAQQKDSYITSAGFGSSSLNTKLRFNKDYVVWWDEYSDNINFFDFKHKVEGRVPGDSKHRREPYLFGNKIVYSELESFGSRNHVDIFTILQ